MLKGLANECHEDYEDLKGLANEVYEDGMYVGDMFNENYITSDMEDLELQMLEQEMFRSCVKFDDIDFNSSLDSILLYYRGISDDVIM